MAPTDIEVTKNQNLPPFASGGIDTLKIPTWFIAIVLVLLSFRVYTKLTQMSAPVDKGVAWLTPDQFEKLSAQQSGTKSLVLFEFTADWCPPCQKRERTTFRARSIIDEINNNFIPVRVDLTTKADSEKASIKQLAERFHVSTIPRCVIALKSGQFVADDRYLFTRDFSDFLKSSEKESTLVRAEIELAKGNYAEAISKLDPEYVHGRALHGMYQSTGYLMTHHLLLELKRDMDAEAMMRQTLDATRAQCKSDKDESNSIKSLELLNSYLRGQTAEDKLLKGANSDSEKAAYYLAIGLEDLRQGDKAKALKALHQAAVNSAKSYNSDQLAEFLTKELE